MRLEFRQTLTTTVTTETRRRSGCRRTLPLAMLAAASLIAGCAAMSPKPAASGADTKEPYLVLRLAERRLYLKEGGAAQPPQGYLVAVGKAQYPTPVGKFAINEM